MATLVALDRARCLTSSQVSRLLLRGDAETLSDPTHRAVAIAAADRQANRAILRPLKDLALVQSVRPWLRGESGVLARKETNLLAPAGVEVVQAHYDELRRGQVARPAPDPTIIDGSDRVHDEMVAHAFVAFRRSATATGRTLWGWRDDRDLAQIVQERATTMRGVVPDALFVLSARDAEGVAHHTVLLIEMDRGTESVVSVGNRSRNWASKVERYELYLERYWASDPLLRGFPKPPILLGVTIGPRRLPHLVAATAERQRLATWRLGLLADLLGGPRTPLEAPIWTDPTAGSLSPLDVLLDPVTDARRSA